VFARGNDLVIAARRGDAFVAGEALTVDSLSAFGLAELTGDGRVDLLLATTSGHADALGLNRLTGLGGSVEVTVLGATGATDAHGARVEVDLDGDGDFSSAGRLRVLPVPTHPVAIGIGEASSVDLRVVFVDVGEAGGNVETLSDVAAGESVTVEDPQAE
jgi:hypothetical protein